MATGAGSILGGGLTVPADGNAQVIMLLTVSLGRADRDGPRPLTGLEWHRLAVARQDRGMEPGALLDGDLSDLLSGWADREVTLPRLESLLERGLALGIALEKWERAGLWAITGSDHDYPARLRERLGGKRPPVLFGCGDRARLAGGGVAVVGSRDADSEDLQFSEDLGVAAAEEGCGVISGGARGVDQKAMLGALERGGSATGVLPGGLLGAASSARYRDFLLSGNLTLVSPFNPESGFGVGKAMGRNRCIYCLADSAVVVSSTFGKGGTWTGATECLKAKWVPVWVRDRDGMNPGNAELLKRGARRLSRHVRSIAELGSLELQAPPQLAGIVDAHHADGPTPQAEPARATGPNGPREPDGRDASAPGPGRPGIDPAGATIPEPSVHIHVRQHRIASARPSGWRQQVPARCYRPLGILRPVPEPISLRGQGGRPVDPARHCRADARAGGVAGAQVAEARGIRGCH